MAQLGNRVQHVLRAYTAKDQRALRLAAETYRDNPRFNTQDAILQVGEAASSFLEKKGVPGVVERTLIRPPSSQLGPSTPDERQGVVKSSPLFGKYETPIDRRSASEIVSERAKAAAAEAAIEDEKAIWSMIQCSGNFQPHGVIRARAWGDHAVSGSKMWDRHWVKHW